MDNKVKTQILFLIFNRPNTTQKVFDEIKKARPRQLFVAADGPRENKPDDKEKCNQTRQIIDQVDWNCEVKTLFRDKNLGCQKAVSSAIDWFFQNVEQGIILEDDCLPDQSFFYFCEELLNKYKDDKRIFNISGNNFQNGIQRGDGSYYFSKYFHCWGWATWADRWNNFFNIDMKKYYKFKEENFKNVFNKKNEQKYWMSILDNVFTNKINSWAYIWSFNCWDNHGINCLPNINLVKNIGFDEQATHTTNINDKKANLKIQSINIPLLHPKEIKTNEKADEYTKKNHFKINFKRNIIWKLMRRIKNGLK